jgi:cellulose synthase/poly-beta-1,6-N-acetylglucosamine synthase-like glycosyltransferase
VSKANFNVLDVLEETIERVRSSFHEYKLWVVVDEGSEGIPVLKALSRSPRTRFRLVVVPRDYKKGAHKARALNYFTEYYVKEDRWYVLLDDDSYPLDRNFLYELDESRALVYVGILAPRKGRSLIAWLADAIRFHGEITRNRFALVKLKKPIFGLHGELLIVHGSVLKMIGFETDSLAEDTWFAARLIERGIPVTQTRSRVSILSPGSVADLWRQRSRWNLGVLRDLLKGRYPASLALGKGLEIALWLTGPISYFGAFFLVKHHIREFLPPLAAYAFLTSGGLVVLLAYTLYPTLAMGFRGLLLSLTLLPLTTFLEAISVIYAAINHNKILSSFIIIDKSVSREEIEMPLVPSLPVRPASLAAAAEPGRKDFVGAQPPPRPVDALLL